MQLIEDDAEINPTIPPAQLNYVRCLTDTHKQYTRFFDALLVPRPSHAAFFRDLKGFRSLPLTIQALTLCDPSNASISKEQRIEKYRDVTRQYLGSRFAHPWCRKAIAGMGNTKVGGWWGAEWSATGRKMSKAHREQEDKLHKLLVPLWITFRGKMFPGQSIVEEWWEQRQKEPQLNQWGSDLSCSRSSSNLELKDAGVHKELSMAKSCSHLRESSRLNSEDEDEDEDENDQDRIQRQGDVAATGILRMVAAGMLINSLPKMQKWKLKRELKKRQQH